MSTPPRPTRDRGAETVAGALSGVVVGCLGYVVGLWTLVLPMRWTWGAGWWAPVILCAIVGAIVGRSRG